MMDKFVYLSFLCLFFCTALLGGNESQLIVAATPYVKGSVGKVCLAALDGRDPSVGPVDTHWDFIVRAFEDHDPLFLLNRIESGSLLVLDSKAGDVISNVALGSKNSNPQDLILIDPRKAYVSLQSAKKLLVIDPSPGGRAPREIDFSQFNDEDAYCEMGRMYHSNSKKEVYVLLQHLDRNHFWLPSKKQKARVVVISTVDDTIKTWFELSGSNPVDFKLGPKKEVYVVYTGVTARAEAWQRIKTRATPDKQIPVNSHRDGGVELVDLDNRRSVQTWALEDKIEGDIVDLAFWGEKIVVIAASGNYADLKMPIVKTRLMALDYATGATATLVESGELGYQVLQSLLRAPDGRFLVADRSERNPRVRVFDGTTLAEGKSIPMPLPPYQMMIR